MTLTKIFRLMVIELLSCLTESFGCILEHGLRSDTHYVRRTCHVHRGVSQSSWNHYLLERENSYSIQSNTGGKCIGNADPPPEPGVKIK